jgi:hypothetical protein
MTIGDAPVVRLKVLVQPISTGRLQSATRRARPT